MIVPTSDPTTRVPTQRPTNDPTTPNPTTLTPTIRANGVDGNGRDRGRITKSPTVNVPTKFPTKKRTKPKYKAVKATCDGKGRVFNWRGSVKRCSEKRCGGATCEFWKDESGFKVRSCESERSTLATSLEGARLIANGPSCSEKVVAFENSVSGGARALASTATYSLIKSNMLCQKGVTFTSTYSKLSLDACKSKCDSSSACGAFIYTSIRACKLLARLEDCSAQSGGTQTLYAKITLSPTAMPETSSPTVKMTPSPTSSSTMTTDAPTAHAPVRTETHFTVAKYSVFCRSGVNFISTFSSQTIDACKSKCASNEKCQAFLYTKVKACKLLSSVSSCKTYKGTSTLYAKQEVVVTSSPTPKVVTSSPSAATSSPTYSPSYGIETRFNIFKTNVFCRSGVKFISTFSSQTIDACKSKCASNAKCKAFLYTKVKACKLLSSIASCKSYKGTSTLYEKQEVVVTSPPSGSPAPTLKSWNSVFSISNAEELSDVANGASGDVVLLLEAMIPFEDDAEPDEEKVFILGLKTSQQAVMWIDGEKIVEADKTSMFCGAAGTSMATATLRSNSQISVQYVYGDNSGSPELSVILYTTDAETAARLSECDIDPDDEDLSPLPPGTIFIIDMSGCEEGYEGARCTLPVCGATCANGGICAAPEICSCPVSYDGPQCSECATGYLKVFGSCQKTSLAIIGGACIALVIAGALLTPKIRQHVELRQFAKFIKDELEHGFGQPAGGGSMKWTTNALLRTQDGLKRENKFKESGMWKLITTQSKPDLQLMKAHFIPKKELQLGKRFASGASGQVCKATYSSTSVCVKQLYSLLIDPEDMREFINEASILAQMTHPKVVRFYGIAVDSDSLLIVTELCEMSLLDFMKQRGTLSSLHKAAILLQISRGMEYVHSKGLVHRDLKMGNILVEKAKPSGIVDVKIADFGVSTATGENKHKELVGTPGHIAPEVIIGQVKPELVKKVDVFSFGMLCWNVFADNADATNSSMHSFDTSDDLNKAIAKRFRPKIHSSWPTEIQDLIRDCWAKNPKQRPSFETISARLASIVESSATDASINPAWVAPAVKVAHKSWVARLSAKFSSLIGKRPSGPPPPLPPALPPSRDTTTLSCASAMDEKLPLPRA